jgi:hypothetical protein
MTTKVRPGAPVSNADVRDFASRLAAACESGRQDRSHSIGKHHSVDAYEDTDLAQAWKVGWEQVDRELREAE